MYPDASAGTGTAEVYRFWSLRSRHHFYTASATERDGIIADYHAEIWSFEGGAFRVPVS